MLSILELATHFARDDGDTQDIKSEKTAVYIVAVSCCIAGLVWVAMYAVIFGVIVTALLPALFVVIVGSSLVASHILRNHRIAVYAQIFSIIAIPAGIQWSIGGLFDSGFVLAWALLGPLAALMFLTPKQSIAWFALYFTTLTITVVFDDSFAGRALDVSVGTKQLFFSMNLGVSSIVVFAFAGYFVKAATRERSAANRLLLNVLPASIAERLKSTEGTIADQYDSISVLFADVVDSTPLFAELTPSEVVEWLNEVFTVLDNVVDRHGLEKLQTIGDGYMVGSGVPIPRDDHAVALVDCCLDMIRELETLEPRHGKHMRFRFGINSGPVVAGVIGKRKFHYDVWGDAVNVASRMESTSEAGRIHVSRSTYDLIAGIFGCTPRGTIEVKGKGEMQTWFVDGRRSP